jgi:hypothetical protein
VVAYGKSPVALHRDVLPGQSATFTEALTAPPQAGHYRIAWDLEQDPGTWFSQQNVLPRVTAWKVGSSLSTATPIPARTPTPRSHATRDLSYIADTAAPDGTHETAGTTFQKGWLVFNSGDTAWTTAWKLKRISGSAMGQGSFAAPHVPSCTSANVLLSLRAPTRAGTYRSRWSLVDPGGHRVGDVLTVNVVVVGSPVPGGTPTATPIPGPTRPPKPSPTPTPVG